MSRRRLSLLVPLFTILIALVGWLFVSSRTPAAPVLVADVPMPALAAYQGQDLRVHLSFSPGRPGDNRTSVRLTNWDGSAFAGEAPESVRVQFSNLALETRGEAIAANPGADGVWSIDGSRLSDAGWWEVMVSLRWTGQADVDVPFYLLMPDPNLNGLDAPEVDPPADPAAATTYQQAMAAYTSMHTVRYAQAMASQAGSVSYGVHVVNDGADGSEPGFTFDIPGGWQYIVLGETAWSKRPGQPWTKSEANPMIPPARWDDEYSGARGFQFGRTETINGEPCRVLTFVVPGEESRVVAWYVWWIGTESGRVHREVMISQSHYMRSDFSDFDQPVVILPPEAPPS